VHESVFGREVVRLKNFSLHLQPSVVLASAFKALQELQMLGPVQDEQSG
jgi:hypothetical protein